MKLELKVTENDSQLLSMLEGEKENLTQKTKQKLVGHSRNNPSHSSIHNLSIPFVAPSVDLHID